MKKYDSYKDSGVEWIGEVPENWEVSKVKFLFDTQKGKTPKNLLDKIEENSLVYLAMDYLRGEPKQVFFVSNNENVVLTDENETLLLWDGSNAGEFLKSKKGVLSSTMALIKSKIIDNQFQWYSFKSFESILKDSCNGMGIPHVDGKFFRGSAFLVPPIEEQTAIANYLDHKTNQIDHLISKKEQFIQLLEEERVAVINQAVTKGLDPSVPMKDSGIEWLGEIPEHWEVKKLKFVSKITRGAILRPVDEPTYFDENGEWTYLNISDATICDKYLDYGKLRLSELGSCKSARVEPNNLIITASATIGKPFINRIPVCVHDGFIPITELQVNIDFLYNYFKNPQLFNGLGKSNTQKNIYLEDVKNLIIPIPSYNEQLNIAQFIEEEILRIETLMSNTNQEIELLKEYKTVLISEVVTGKVDIRDEFLN